MLCAAPRCRERGFSSKRMVSRAYHESLFMAQAGSASWVHGSGPLPGRRGSLLPHLPARGCRGGLHLASPTVPPQCRRWFLPTHCYCCPPVAQIAPTGMIFIPCRNGWSHRPDEFASPADIARGVEVLALALARLAGGAAELRAEL